MSAERPHARQSAAARKQAAARRQRMLSLLIPLGVLLVAGIIAFVVVSGGGSEEPPAPGSDEELALGQEVFSDNCATCHGEELRGGLAGPPLAHELYVPERLPDSAIRQAIANGVPPKNWDYAGMPPIPNLSGPELDAVIAYVRDVQADVLGTGSS